MDDTPIQVTTKNPKKVEQGKKLAEYNRKQREKLKSLRTDEINIEKQIIPVKNNGVLSTTKDFNMYIIGGLVVIFGSYIGYKIYFGKKNNTNSLFQNKTDVKVNKNPNKFEME